MKELIEIQKELKVHKSQVNKFGNYNYRSCEDILEAVKPLCIKHNCLLTLSDEIVMLGDRFYIKATATIRAEHLPDIEIEGKGTMVVANCDRVFSVSAYAREAETKKGMDASQITGSASSYARKYALNGLFCIDDTKDADTMDNTVPLMTTHQKGTLRDYMAGFKKEDNFEAMEHLQKHLDNKNLTEFEAGKVISDIKKYLEKNNDR